MRLFNVLLVFVIAVMPKVAAADGCDKPTSAREQIRVCTQQISSKRWSGQNLAIIHNNRGNGYQALRLYKQAIEDYRRAIDINPLYPTPYYNRGNAYMAQRRYAWAIEDYTVAIRLRPKYPDAYGNRGLANERSGNRAAAIRDFRAAIRQRPGDRVGTRGLTRLRVK